MNEERYCFRCKYAEAIYVFDTSDGVFKRGWKCNLTPSSPAISDSETKCIYSDEEFRYLQYEYEKDGFDIKMFVIICFISLIVMTLVTVLIIWLW